MSNVSWGKATGRIGLRTGPSAGGRPLQGPTEHLQPGNTPMTCAATAMTYNERTSVRRHFTATRCDGQPCRGWALWDELEDGRH
jgi:hypothetical protein